MKQKRMCHLYVSQNEVFFSVIGVLALAYISYQWLNTPTLNEVKENQPKSIETVVYKEPDKETDTDIQRSSLNANVRNVIKW